MKARQKGKQNKKREMEYIFKKLISTLVDNAMKSLVKLITEKDRTDLLEMIENRK